MFCFENISRNALSQKPRELLRVSSNTEGKQAKGEKNIIKQDAMERLGCAQVAKLMLWGKSVKY